MCWCSEIIEANRDNILQSLSSFCAQYRLGDVRDRGAPAVSPMPQPYIPFLVTKYPTLGKSLPFSETQFIPLCSPKAPSPLGDALGFGINQVSVLLWGFAPGSPHPPRRSTHSCVTFPGVESPRFAQPGHNACPLLL